MKQYLVLTFAAIMILLIGLNTEMQAGTYASSLRVSNPDSTKPFDGSFVDGTGARLWFALNGGADSVEVWVLAGGPGGIRVRALDTLKNVAPGQYSVSWDGKDNTGKFVSPGRYSFEVFTSDSGNSTSGWVQAWQNPVYLLAGGGLSSRDIEVVQDPESPLFGNLIMTESTTFYGYARMIMARANGSFVTEYSRFLFPQGTSDFDPWFISIARNGEQYVTSSALQSIFVYRDTVLVKTYKDTSKFKDPKGIVAIGTGDPTLYLANGRFVLRRAPAGTIDTVFAVDTVGAVAGYTRDVAVDDSGYVFVSFGATSSSYAKVIRISPTKTMLDTLVLPENVTHLNMFYGADRTTNADDILYCRVRGANGGVFRLDSLFKRKTKLFTPSTSTSGSHSLGIDVLGNIYYANPSAEWVRMYVPPSTAPTKWTTKSGDFMVLSTAVKVMDNFDAGVGHFSVAPTYSGSTIGISSSSSAKQTPLAAFNGTGSMEVTLLDNPASASPWEVRFLSGIGTPASNDSLGAVGWVGYWMRTNNAPPHAMVAIGLDDPSDPATKRSVRLPVVGDGSWHLYQWNIADSTQWTPWVVTSGSPKIKGPRVSIDAVWFFAPDSSQPWTIGVDEVSYNPNGLVGIEAGTGDVTGNGTVSALDASWILQFVVRLRQFAPHQVVTGDVNLSHTGLAVNAFDAGLILAKVVGKVPYLPWKQALPPLQNTDGESEAPLSIILASVKGNAGQVVTIPISIPQNLAGLRSAEMKLLYNSTALKIRNVITTNLTKDFAVESNIQDGSVLIAMASAEALAAGGQILAVEAEVLQSSGNISVQLQDVTLNETKVNSVTSVGGTVSKLPTTYDLLQNYPNPFNPSTTIEYQLPQNGFVDLKVYDITGREVTTLVATAQNAGRYTITWNAVDAKGYKVASGVYLYRLSAGSFSQIKKMMLLK